MQNWIVAFERLHERADPRIGMQKRKRGAKVGKSGRGSGAQRYLPLVISARWTPISQHFPADRRSQTLLRSRQSNRSLMQCRPRTCGSSNIREKLVCAFPCVHAVATTPAQRLGVLLRSFTQPYQPSPKGL